MGEERVRRLERERLRVEVVAEDAEEEDGGGERVAAVVRVPPCETGEKLVIELCGVRDVSVWLGWNGSSWWEAWRSRGAERTLTSYDVPEERVLDEVLSVGWESCEVRVGQDSRR